MDEMNEAWKTSVYSALRRSEGWVPSPEPDMPSKLTTRPLTFYKLVTKSSRGSWKTKMLTERSSIPKHQHTLRRYLGPEKLARSRRWNTSFSTPLSPANSKK